MAFTADTGPHRPTRSDVFLIDPRALVVDWRKNLSRNGQEPSVDDALMDLARDMIPKRVRGDSERGSSGQINPILVRPLPDRRLEVIGGFRRMRAALWLIETGVCPNFKIKYIVTRVSDAEAALSNISENIQREDPKPIELAHAVRSLTEDYGMTLNEVAGRLKRSTSWLSSLLDLVTLPKPVQESVSNGQLAVSAALELTKLPSDQQKEIFNSLKSSGEKVTAEKVREMRQEAHESTGKGGPVRRSRSVLVKFLESKSGDSDVGSEFAGYLLDFLEGKKSEDQLTWFWNRMFREKSKKSQ